MNTLFFGQHILRLDQIDSTNNYTSEFMRHNVIHEGCVVVADHQTNGKGQRGNVWQSVAHHNLTFSVYIEPKFLLVQDHFVLNKWASLSVMDVLQSLGLNAMVKWPNDVYVDGSKIAGILIENTVGARINHSIVGIGLNINQTRFEGLDGVTSVRLATGNTHKLDKVMSMLCSEMERHYLKIKKDKKALDQYYRDNLYQGGFTATYRDSKGEFSGVIVGINPNGLLQILTDGKVRNYAFKEVEFL